MASLKDVATLAGVATGTVSRFLNNPEQVHRKTRAKVQQAIEQLNYSPNMLGRNLRRGHTGLVVVIVPAVGDPFYGEVIRGITRVGDHLGLSIHIREARAAGPAQSSDVGDFILSRQAEGIILLGGPSSYDLSEDFLKRTDHPPIVVAAGRASEEYSSFAGVQINNIEASRQLTAYLIGLGHARIGYIRGEPWFRSETDREAGYRLAMREAGHRVEESAVTNGNLTIQGAREATRRLLHVRPRLTAIVCANDEMALGTMAEIRASGLDIPGDISVAGFDNIRYSEIATPPLTTIEQPAQLLGERSLYRLAAAMRDPSSENGIDFVNHRLIVRESTGVAPARNTDR